MVNKFDPKLKKKILVTSLSSWNVRSGADTFSVLLHGYGSDNVANIYFKNEPPTSDVSEQYFCISESDVLRSIFISNHQTGWRQQRENPSEIHKAGLKEQQEKMRYAFWSKHRLWIILLAREIAWVFGKWKSEALKKFVDEFNPDIILFPIEQYMYFNRVNQWLIRKTNCKAIAFFWDDNFTYKQYPYDLGYRVHRFFLRKQVKHLVNQCKTIFTICPKMKMECDAFFHINSVMLSKGCNCTDAAKEWIRHELPFHIVYTGNLNIGRDLTLLVLLKAIEKVNQLSQYFVLDVYSMTHLSEKTLMMFENHPDCIYHGAVNQTQIKVIHEQADILLLAEALTGRHRNVSRLSFSTKIADYLSRKRCILDIAPQNIATTEYLKKENAALIACSDEDIVNILEHIIDNPDLLSQYGTIAYHVALKNHNIHIIQKKLYEKIND